MKTIDKSNLAACLALGAVGIVPKDIVVQEVQMWIQENGPLPDDMADTFKKIMVKK